MGYSRNKSAIERVKPLLEMLLNSDVDVEFPSQDPHKLVYYLRDGFAVARGLQSSPFKELHDKWRLRAKRDVVLAELKSLQVIVGIPLLAKKLAPVRLESVTEVMEVIGAAIKHRAPKLEFPNAHIRENGLRNLEKWCNANSYIIVQSEPHLIIEKNGTNNPENGGVEHRGHSVVE